MPWWVWLLVFWLVLAVSAALVLGRMVGMADRRERDFVPPAPSPPDDLCPVDRLPAEFRAGPLPLPLPRRPAGRPRAGP